MRRKWFGWQSEVELGNIITARSAEILVLVWVTPMMKWQAPMFNFKVVK
jgi:hypothetical protein